MKETRLLMGMHITVEVIDNSVTKKDIDEVYTYFSYIDTTFSTYKESSEVSKINYGLLKKEDYSRDMKEVISFCEKTKKETSGYFDCYHNDTFDPSGIVKGWAILQAADLLKRKGFKNFYVDAGGDVQVSGKNKDGKFWKVGIQNPFNREQIVKVVELFDKGIATSGTAVRGQHIYDPHDEHKKFTKIVSLSVIGPNVFEADRFATAAFAMEEKGIAFIESLPGFEGYMIDTDGIATYTNGFETFVCN